MATLSRRVTEWAATPVTLGQRQSQGWRRATLLVLASMISQTDPLTAGKQTLGSTEVGQLRSPAPLRRIMGVKSVLAIIVAVLAGSTALVGCVIGGVLSFAVWNLLPETTVRTPIAVVVFFVSVAVALLFELRDRR